MSYDPAKATHEILKVWDGELQKSPSDTPTASWLFLHLEKNHPDLLNPSLNPDEQYDDIKSRLTKSGRLHK